jgi:hypothetical protein
MLDKVVQIVSVEWMEGHRLKIQFDDGLAGDLDLSAYSTYGPIFEKLKDIHFFKQVSLVGGTLSWPNGADIAPERLYELLAGKV